MNGFDERGYASLRAATQRLASLRPATQRNATSIEQDKLMPRGIHNRGTGKQRDAQIRASRNFQQRSDIIPAGWSLSSVAHSDDRAIITYARTITGKDITSVDAALTAINAHGTLMSLATLRYRAISWWRDYGRHVHAP